MAAKTETLPQLFDSVKEKLLPTLGPDRWYLVAASTLVTTSDPSNFGHLWTYLTRLPEYQTVEQRRALNKRLREFIMKQWVTVGAPRAVIALFALIKEEKPGDADLGFSKGHAGLTPTNSEQGLLFLRHFFTEEQMKGMWSTWGQDMKWLTKDIIYGMFYADDTILGNIDTQLITYTAIACQGLGVTVSIHLGGLLSMGLSVEEVERVTECAKMVAEWAGVETSGWPNVRKIAAEVRERKEIVFH